MKSSYSIRRQVANTYLVRERDRRMRRDLLGVLAVAVPLSIAVLAYVWISSQVLAVGYEVRRLEQRLEDQSELERQLRRGAAVLSRHERVEALAADRLGLQPIELEQVVFAQELE